MSPSAKPRAVLVDLDSTLCDTTHRRHLAPGPEHRHDAGAWAAYAAACADDDPILGTLQVVLLLSETSDILLLTGRNESARPATERWLERWGVSYARLVMRPDDETRLHAWKVDQIEMLTQEYDICLALDDMPQGIEGAADCGVVGLLVANAWREETKALVRGERAPA